ncbi:cupin domain-containing protein [Pseudomonas aeruginosa]|uniref:cupin domain-containing protein n=1 Tax=Pseudomonas aeruginosa TaxID=287 RepID=UPI000B5A4DAE|nr:cupin domain-containing protein [Pseudomonas aeruginosa]ASJ88601.1 Cupin domain protein [Pseudomonas aeruginosa]RUE83528.1 cupin domain-containing protein [Pseudomonas aeruginosa]
MNTANLKDMVKGWFVGGFNPTAYSTEACEVGVKNYKQGDSEGAHYHKVATEITLVLSGKVTMRDQVWEAGDIIVLEPGEVTAFEAMTDATTVVVKVPGALNDKYVV